MGKRHCQEILRQHLSPGEYAAFMALAANLGAFPCEYDTATGRFEPALDAIDPETTESDTLDAVLTACDVLAQHVDELNLDTVTHTASVETGQATLLFDFAADDPVLPVFLALMEPLTKNGDYRIDVRRNAADVDVVVTLRYTGNQEYQCRIEEVKLRRDIAERRLKGQLFQGHRI